jgi:hypothetical protein
MKSFRQVYLLEYIDTDISSMLCGPGMTETAASIAKMHGIHVDCIRNCIKKGIVHEFEHTNNVDIAISIAKDHIIKDPFYYDHLEAIEKYETDDLNEAEDKESIKYKVIDSVDGQFLVVKYTRKKDDSGKYVKKGQQVGKFTDREKAVASSDQLNQAYLKSKE